MAFEIMLKRFKLRRVGARAVKNKAETQRIWTGISHGFHTVERDGNGDGGSVHARREQVEGLELWLFGVHDQQMGSEVTKYFQSQLLDNNPTEYDIRMKCKETMKKAYLSTRAAIQEEQGADDIKGSASVLVINGERFVAATVGGYRAVLCRDGLAKQLGSRQQRRAKRRWSVSGVLSMRCTSVNGENNNPDRSTRLVVTKQKVNAETEFIILASKGVWEVMRNQEAVDLIAHVDDAQQAAECLAEEALNRMSKSAISCVVIRFH